jgi:hypothetical protein
MARLRGLRRRGIVLAVAAGMTLALAAGAIAGHHASGVKSYTGCLGPNDGAITKVKEGDAPKYGCTSGQTQVHLSGGDITKISVTGALTGGGDNGEVTIGLKPEATLPSGCANGQVAEWNGSAWACGTDNDTTYAAGTGLDLSAAPANSFSIEPGYRLPGKACSSSGQFATGFDSDGDIQCSAPAASAVQVFTALESPESGIGIPSDQRYHDVVTLSVPAGTYSITAIGNASQGDPREWSIQCALVDDSALISLADEDGDSDELGGGITDGASMAMASVRTFSGSTILKVVCATAEDGVGAEHFVIQAIRFG